MAVTGVERKRWEQAVEAFIERRRPPQHLRTEVDMGFRIKGQSVVLFELRLDWRTRKTMHECSFARATYVRIRNLWRVYWMRRDLKWHRYPPQPEVRTIGQFLAVVDRDDHHCFFG